MRQLQGECFLDSATRATKSSFCLSNLYLFQTGRFWRLCVVVEMTRNPPEGVSVGLVDDDNMFLWEIMVIGPSDTEYEGGFFKAQMQFPDDFPLMPPTMTFLSEMWHPNSSFLLLLVLVWGLLALFLCRFGPPFLQTNLFLPFALLFPFFPSLCCSFRLLIHFASPFLVFPSPVYEDGRVCISILHPPGVDEFNEQESAEERWRPVLGVEAIILSVS